MPQTNRKEPNFDLSNVKLKPSSRISEAEKRFQEKVERWQKIVRYYFEKANDQQKQLVFNFIDSSIEEMNDSLRDGIKGCECPPGYRPDMSGKCVPG